MVQKFKAKVTNVTQRHILARFELTLLRAKKFTRSVLANTLSKARIEKIKKNKEKKFIRAHYQINTLGRMSAIQIQKLIIFQVELEKCKLKALYTFYYHSYGTTDKTELKYL